MLNFRCLRLADELAHAAQDVRDNPAGSLRSLRNQLAAAIGTDCTNVTDSACPVVVDCGVDESGALRNLSFGLQYTVVIQKSTSLLFDFAELAQHAVGSDLSHLHELVDVSGNSSLRISGSATLSLALGVRFVNDSLKLSARTKPFVQARVHATVLRLSAVSHDSPCVLVTASRRSQPAAAERSSGPPGGSNSERQRRG